MANSLDREYIRQQVTGVLQSWGVIPSGRGSGVGDVEYWTDVVQDIHQERPPDQRGWEPYWIDRIGRECANQGYHQGTPIPPPPMSQGDPYMAALNRIEAKVDNLTAKLQRYF